MQILFCMVRAGRRCLLFYSLCTDSDTGVQIINVRIKNVRNVKKNAYEIYGLPGTVEICRPI